MVVVVVMTRVEMMMKNPPEEGSRWGRPVEKLAAAESESQ